MGNLLRHLSITSINNKSTFLFQLIFPLIKKFDEWIYIHHERTYPSSMNPHHGIEVEIYLIFVLPRKRDCFFIHVTLISTTICCIHVSIYDIFHRFKGSIDKLIKELIYITYVSSSQMHASCMVEFFTASRSVNRIIYIGRIISLFCVHTLWTRV